MRERERKKEKETVERAKRQRKREREREQRDRERERQREREREKVQARQCAVCYSRAAALMTRRQQGTGLADSGVRTLEKNVGRQKRKIC